MRPGQDAGAALVLEAVAVAGDLNDGGVMQDAVPGRLAELWFKAEREGVYFGQCSELCGKDHAYMPITVKVVSEQVYADWVARTKTADAGASAQERVASKTDRVK